MHMSNKIYKIDVSIIIEQEIARWAEDCFLLHRLQQPATLQDYLQS